MRDVPGPLYGVTVDDVTNSSAIVASSQHLAHRPTTRVVFDKGVGPSYYKPAVQAMEPSSYVMGEILDSSDVQSVPTDLYKSRTSDYVSQLGNDVDIWEVGNEINGEWLGSTSDVVAKMTGAYDIVKAASKRTALTLFYEPDCGSLADHEMFTWAQNNVPTSLKQGLDYVLVSYYEQDCNNVRPTQAQWQGVFDRLRGMFPTARLGFGEVGLVAPATSSTQTRAADAMNYYYHLQINTPGYVGGYFWWYYYEDCLPWSNKPMWQTLNSALTSMPIPTA